MIMDKWNNLKYPLISENIHIRKVSEEDQNSIYIVIDSDWPSWIFVNKDGLEIINLLNGKNSVVKIAREIANRHHNEYADSFLIVNSFLEQLKDNQLLHGNTRSFKKKNLFRGIALEITRKCNLRCIHCYLAAGKRNKKELKFDEIRCLLNSTKDLGGLSVAIGGGEPFLRKDCIKIIEYALSLDLLILVGTNGTLINRNLAKQLSNLPIKIQISLDGASKEIHDQIRGPDNFNRTIRGIDNLIKEGMEKNIVIAFTPMRINITDLSLIIEFALERNIPVIQFPPLSPSGRAKSRWKALKLTDNEVLNFWDLIEKKTNELKGKIDLCADCFSININNPGLPYRCSIGTQLRIDPEGNVYPCQCFHSGMEFCIGNVRETVLEKIVNSERLENIKRKCFQRPYEIEDCRSCEWKNFCGSGCMGIAYERKGTILCHESCLERKHWVEKLFENKFKEISIGDFR